MPRSIAFDSDAASEEISADSPPPLCPHYRTLFDLIIGPTRSHYQLSRSAPHRAAFAKLDLRFVEQPDLRSNAVEALDCAVAVDPADCLLFEVDNDAHRDRFLCRCAPAYHRPGAFALTRQRQRFRRFSF
jgi:hypothetical protein